MRFSGPGMPYAGLAKATKSGVALWTGEVRTVPEVLDQPLRWKKSKRIFVNSMSDLFHEDVPIGFIYQVFAVMAEANWHTFQVLTKRPGRMKEVLTKLRDEFEGKVFNGRKVTWPLPNVWLGVSVENQQAADERIPLLLQTPAAVRFVSCEPLLGPVDLERHLNGGKTLAEWKARALSVVDPYGFRPPYPRIHWVIVGGESGPGARPMHPDWVRSIRDQCQAAGVPFFFKQWGQWEPAECRQGETVYRKVSDDTVVLFRSDVETDRYHWWGGNWGDGKPLSVRVGKKAAGRMLDGREWNEMPEVYDAD